jgi:glycosyltransferase 2 family protein
LIESSPPASRRLLKILLGLAISAALLVVLFWEVDLRDMGARLATTNWSYLAASAALNLLSILVRAWRWHYLFPPGARPSHLFRALMIGYMGNNLLPLRAGEIVRVYVASRRGQRFWTTLATIVVERALDGLAVGMMVAALFLVIPIPASLRWPAVVFLIADLAAILLFAILALAPGACSAIIRALFHRWGAAERRLMDVLGTVNEGLAGVRAAHHLLPIAVWSVAIWLLLAASVWTALRAVGFDLPLAASWAVLAFTGLGVSLPSSPGFVGVVQAAAVLALALFGVPRADALSFSLLAHAAQFFPVTLFGLALLLAEHVSLSEATQTRHDEDFADGPAVR